MQELFSVIDCGRQTTDYQVLKKILEMTVAFLDTLQLENLNKIALSCTVNEIKGNLTIFSKVGREDFPYARFPQKPTKLRPRDVI